MRNWLPALALLAVSTLALATARLVPETGEAVAVVFAPGTDEARAYVTTIRAGGRVLKSGAFDNVLIARGDAAFAARVMRAGAWFVVSARGASGCGDVARIDCNDEGAISC